MVGRWSHWFSLSLLALMGPLRAGPAQACGMSSTPWYTVIDMAPSGAEVPLNAPIVVRLDEVVVDGNLPPLDASLLLYDGTLKEERAVPASILGLSPDGELSFVPEADLPPNTTFSASFFSGQEDPSLTSSPRAIAIRSFTTGTETAPSLSLEGELSVTLEPGEDRALECPNACSGCTATGPAFAVTKARVKLPRLVGGFATQRAELWLTDNVPQRFDNGEPNPHVLQLGGWLSVDELEAGEALWTLPEEQTPYRPCFAFKAFDARGDVVEAAPLCLEEADDFAGAPVTGGPGAMAPGQSASSRNSSACSFVPTSAGYGAWLPALLLLGALSRRKSRTCRVR
jgi:hypothetical protein